VNARKEVKTFPKKSADPAKAETCASDYVVFKKEVLNNSIFFLCCTDAGLRKT
jgi:hypothetical protein